MSWCLDTAETLFSFHSVGCIYEYFSVLIIVISYFETFRPPVFVVLLYEAYLKLYVILRDLCVGFRNVCISVSQELMHWEM